MRFFVMFVTAVCMLFLIKLRWPKKKNFYDNERNFPQAELDSEINVRFLWNEHGDLSFLLHNHTVHTILLNLKKSWKMLSEGKKDIGERVQETVTLRCKLWPVKITTLRTVYVLVVLNSVIFPQILYNIVLYVRHFLPVKFFPEYYFYKLCFELPQNVTCTDE